MNPRSLPQSQNPQEILTLEIVRPNIGHGPNDRIHFMARARRTKDIREQVRLVGAAFGARRRSGAQLPATLRYTVTWAKGKRRLNDADNLIAQLKPCTDGLKDAGLIHDDSPAWLTLLPVEQRKGTQAMISVQIDLTWLSSGSPLSGTQENPK